ncbi:MAG: hypothetical protein U0791_00270 [Gemmataceae bacterium]
MTIAVRQLLDVYRSLPEAEKHEATVEILSLTSDSKDLPEDSLVFAADELFQVLDDEEARHAHG